MRKILTVASAEYALAVKTKAFLISVFLMPILMGGVIAIKPLLEDTRDITDKEIAVVDLSGSGLVGDFEEASAKRNAEKLNDEAGKQIHPRYVIENVRVDGDEDEAQLELSNRVRDGDLHAYLWIEKGVLDPDAKSKATFHCQSTSNELRGWLGQVLTESVQQRRFEGAAELASLRKRLTPVPVVPQELAERASDGTIRTNIEDTKGTQTLLGVGLGLMMFMLVMSGAPRQLNCVIEEKMNRVSEVLLGSVSPFDLMMGKLISSVAVSLTLAVLYLGGGFLVLQQFELDSLLDPQILVWFTLYTVAGVFLFGSLFIAVGAACNDLNDAQTLMTPVMIVVMLPMFVWPHVIQEPNSAFSVGSSFVPFASPMLMLTRLAIPPGPTGWYEPWLALFLCAVTAVLCVVAAGRIFRVGLLMQGQAPKFSQLLRWIFRA